MSLISLADLKSFIHMGENHDDAELQNVIDGVESEITTYLGYDLTQIAPDTEYHDGDRSNTILLDNGAVTAVNSVKIDADGDYTYSETLIHQVDYVWYANGVIQLITGRFFPRKQKYIEVNYDHGYTSASLPKDLVLALKKKMANVYYGSRQVQEIGMTAPTRIFSDKEIYGVFDRHARVQI